MYRTSIYLALVVAALAFHPIASADSIGGGKPESTETTTSWFDGFWSNDDVEPESDDSGE